MRSIRSNSRTVRTASTSRPPSVESSGTSHSYFFATQGMTETQKILFFPPASAASLRVFLTSAPIIWWGDFALESCGTISG